MENSLEHELRSRASAEAWKKVGVYDHHGIVVHLSSIHNETSCGIGEFLDLIPLITWCKDVGFDVIQLLPINDTAFDPSPYNACSSCAIHPIYLSLSALDDETKDEQLKEKLTYFDQFKKDSSVAYKEILVGKRDYLKRYFDLYKEQITSSAAYQKFLVTSEWVRPYGLFKSLKEQFHQANHLSWPSEIQSPTEKEYDDLCDLHKENIDFFIFEQYLCYKQLMEVREHAFACGIFIKGDIPLLISPDSVDVWSYPDNFILDFRAGAPPDKYNPDGQNWGFPLFNWGVVSKQDYYFWRQRMGYASHFYDIFRIDHVLGLFRIWSVLKDCDPKLGRFSPSNELVWEDHGRRHLKKIISFTEMLPIAEDLGLVPPCVGPVLQSLGVCGTKVMRWERMWDEDKKYIDIDKYPRLSMTTVSTHDSPTLAQWWRDFPEEVAVYCEMKGWRYDAELSDEYRLSILKDSHRTSSIFHINLLQEYLSLVPELKRENIDDDRINIPGKILDRNWTYKIKPSIKEIINNIQLKEIITSILSV